MTLLFIIGAVLTGVCLVSLIIVSILFNKKEKDLVRRLQAR